ncbi:hypothetical protein BDP27DRAFT_1424244 [Rhodocollybia butyracea]|uniref:Uncharacterized protein n=1 Tax=Rhodocollybia butyracea TaxID=206335 RepID=A0A9P5U3W5_9AGAR|nr:hypothetical protein BDP27DRAFT_1424244 [Rhodocollybia butyracea]
MGGSERVTAQASTSSKRKLEYKPTKAIAKSSLGVTFTDPTSPLMPKGVAAWAKALSILASRSAVPQRDNMTNGGFVVPPPRCIVSPTQEHIVATLFKSWLRVRDAVLSKLWSPEAPPVKLSNKCWRSLLDVSGGLHSGSASATRSGGSFMVAPTYWEGELILSSGLPDAKIAKAIVWELCKLNFRHELEALDGILDKSRMTWTDRHALLNECWVGSGNKVDIAAASKGLGASCVMDRLPFLQTLHKVMRTWEGVKPVELLDQFPEESSAHNYRGLVERVEFNVALFYCESFLNVYGRAASIPHHL